MSELYIGLISGTSIDGADTVIAEFQAHRCRLVAAKTTAYPDDLKHRVHNLITGAGTTLREIGGLDAALGTFFADCVLDLLGEAELKSREIRAIGHHGQTVHHEPQGAERFTLQLGDPNRLAATTGITTVADFRRLDMALGGQGAPLVPAFHEWLLRDPSETRVVVNIGGIANVTVLRPNRPTVGFDTGPGNTLLDYWINASRGEPFDAAGAWAGRGRVLPALLRECLAEPYFDLDPPKSTGRELFNSNWLTHRLGETTTEHHSQDIQATLAELTAATIAVAIDKLALGEARIIVCGGGAYNADLLARLARLCGRDIESTAAFGLAPDWVEATAFAWLARARLEGAPGNVPTVTGARQAAVLGGVYYGGIPET